MTHEAHTRTGDARNPLSVKRETSMGSGGAACILSNAEGHTRGRCGVSPQSPLFPSAEQREGDAQRHPAPSVHAILEASYA